MTCDVGGPGDFLFLQGRTKSDIKFVSSLKRGLNNNRQPNSTDVDYLDSRWALSFLQHSGRVHPLRFFEWKPAINPFAFVLRIENSGDIERRLTHFVTQF
jgi:hypothetical protein